MSRPPSGSMIYWRFKAKAPCAWTFGYVTYLSAGLLRMGSFNGDTSHGHIVDESEIEWKRYSS